RRSPRQGDLSQRRRRPDHGPHPGRGSAGGRAGGALRPARPERATRAARADPDRARARGRGRDRSAPYAAAGRDRPRRRGGELDADVVIFHDVTEIAEGDRLKDQFLTTIAHDVRSPLATIKGYAQGIARRGERASDASLTRIGRTIDTQVDAIDRMLSDLL